MTFTSIILGLPFTFWGIIWGKWRHSVNPVACMFCWSSCWCPLCTYGWNTLSLSWPLQHRSCLYFWFFTIARIGYPFAIRTFWTCFLFFSNVVEAHCYALQFRRIDCEQLRSSINKQLIVGHFGHEGFISCMQNLFFFVKADPRVRIHSVLWWRQSATPDFTFEW